MKYLKIISIVVLNSLFLNDIMAFCGFYVAKADANLFNKSSEVIISRYDKKTIITMSNDYNGDVKDFAMVVPVPVILSEDDIRIVDHSIFEKLNAYSGPRLVEYYDQNPCTPVYQRSIAPTSVQKDMSSLDMEVIEDEMEYNVVIEAEYTVGEYDIIILSATDSDGLKNWLLDNNYKVPEKASSVLKPYIRSDMKFFVVKVNLEERLASSFENLRPLQIEFESNKFMLPIRLGMANAEDFQDLIIYLLTENGRVETANYRTVKIPTNKNIPEFISNEFGDFYTSVFERAHQKEYRNAVFLEYAWDLGSNNFVKCDPCPVTPPALSDLNQAGASWVSPNYQNRFGGSDYVGNVFMTRLHVRYDRENFPQDLFFTETPNRENFQGRYIMQHAARGVVNCENAQSYFKTVYQRRKKELEELSELTGWNVDKYDFYTKEYKVKLNRGQLNNNLNKGGIGFVMVITMILGLIGYRLERDK